jgi:glutamyl/glutaminyl-tRNA synthetase
MALSHLTTESLANHFVHSRHNYRGRLAPSPTGFLHLGHAQTFWTAQSRAQTARGTLLLRIEDLDEARCRPEFRDALIEDLRWFGFEWQEGPDCGGNAGPYVQSQRRSHYQQAWRCLVEKGLIYPCTCSRADVQRASQAPHAGDDEPVYPGTCRTRSACAAKFPPPWEPQSERANWRFQVPDQQVISFSDGYYGGQNFVAGQDFGDFIVWRHDNVPAYQLAVVVDDALMGISEVVRGADLIRSTARQLLLYRALDFAPPAFYHCPLVSDETGARLAKRHDSLSLRALRAKGTTPAQLRLMHANGC